VLIEAYKTQVVPSLEGYFAWIREQIVEHGGIPNKFGRWRYFPEAAVLQLMRQNKELDDLVRVGINFPIQSGAHDLHQAAHVSIEACPPILQRAKPNLEVHDSFAFEAVDQGQDYLIQTAWLIKEKCEKLSRNLVLWDGSKLGWECLAEISWGPSLGDQQWKLTARGDIIPLNKEEDDNGD
ncbi:hypothetical protein MUP37_02305, partial [Candidatus Bathyarchaeota archaeon]|nr:hypothetical protein [Candidatus Bathyarchaeota archaeon]